MNARAWLAGLAVALVALGVGSYLFRGEIATRLVERSAQQRDAHLIARRPSRRLARRVLRHRIAAA
jgi:F0F1-type ATP synthase membrane subunit c/vacuolar-type H+-ATPase subunit K